MKLRKLLGAVTVILISFASVPSTFAQSKVVLGSDRVFTDYLSELSGKRIGVLAHFASRLSDGTHLVDALAANKNLKPQLIFSPEHGFRSSEDTGVPDGIDAETGIQVYSLYGPRKAPTAEMLARLDVVLIDLQDVGLRYYTYPATVAYVMQAAAASHKPVYILDRPNPIGGMIVEGAMLDSNLANQGLTTIAQIPTRTGMTLAETAVFLNQELNIHVDLHVITMQGWTRDMHWKDTGLTWIPSSPALPTPEQVEAYAMFGTLEAVNLAVGRGMNNDQAFFHFGAPYITEAAMRSMLTQIQLPGLKLTYTEWTPDRAEYLHQLCRGFKVEITDLSKVNGFRSLIVVLEALQKNFAKNLNIDGVLEMLGSKAVLNSIKAQESPDSIMNAATKDFQSFSDKRKAALLY